MEVPQVYLHIQTRTNAVGQHVLIETNQVPRFSTGGIDQAVALGHVQPLWVQQGKALAKATEYVLAGQRGSQIRSDYNPSPLGQQH